MSWEIFGKLAVGVATHLAKWFGPLKKIHALGQTPEKLENLTDDLLERGLQRLLSGAGVQVYSGSVLLAIEGAAVVPPSLQTTNAVNWLSRSDVQIAILEGARSLAIDADIPSQVRQKLVQEYCAASLGTENEAHPLVEIVCAIVAAEINAKVKDPALGAKLMNKLSESNDTVQTGMNEIKAMLGGSVDPEIEVFELTAIDDPRVEEWLLLLKAMSKPLLTWPRKFENGSQIDRPELTQLLAQLAEEEGKTIALVGMPGAGKSALLASLGIELEKRPSTVVVAIKADQLGVKVTTQRQLMQEFQLPQPLHLMVASLGQFFRVIVLLDQVDALAGHLDINTGRLSAILELVGYCSDIPNVHIIVSCREFEYQHDLRLTQLDAERMELRLPTWESVAVVLAAHEIHASSWSEDIRNVLQVPQQLKIFLSIKASGSEEHFANYTSMLDFVWKTRIVDVSGGSDLVVLAFDIAEAMADREVLSIATARFDEHMADLYKLASAGVLDTIGETIRFSHQTMFEHILARSFIRTNGKFASYVIARKNSLFVRPKVWATLTYLRNVEWTTYEEDFLLIWKYSSLPDHIKFLMLEFLGSLSNPRGFELSVMRDAWTEDRLLPIILKAIVGSPGWFNELSNDLIRNGMRAPHWREHFVPLLSEAWSIDAHWVTKLISEEWVEDPENDWKILWALRAAPLWTEDAKKLAIIVSKRADLGNSLNYWLSTVASNEPEFAIDLLANFLGTLRHKAVKSAAEGAARVRSAAGTEEQTLSYYDRSSRPLEELIDGPAIWETANALAENAPKKFLELIFPWFVLICQDLAQFSSNNTSEWEFPLRYGVELGSDRAGRISESKETLVDAIFGAMLELRELDPKFMMDFVIGYRTVSIMPIQRAIAIALTMAPRQYSNDAHQFLMEDKRRLKLGNLQDSAITTRELIQACSPHWSNEKSEALANHIWLYRPKVDSHGLSVDSKIYYARYSRDLRLDLLQTLPAATNMPSAAKASLNGRPVRAQTEGLSVFAEVAKSPLSKEQLGKATVNQVINAFQKVPDGSDWSHPKSLTRGGNIQLSRELSAMAADNPEHAFRILEQLESGSGQRAAGYALEELAKAQDPARVQTVAVTLMNRGFLHEQFQTSIASVVTKLREREVEIEEDLLLKMEQCLWDSAPSSPLDREVKSIKHDAEQPKYLLSEYMELRFVPGEVYPVLSSLAWARVGAGQADAAVNLLKRYWLLDSRPLIWEHMIDIISALIAHRANEAELLVAHVLSLAELDGTHAAARLIIEAAVEAPGAVQTNITRWAKSQDALTRRGYGEIIGFLSICRPALNFVQPLLKEIITDDSKAAEREGAAASIAHIVWRETKYQRIATDVLLQLLERNEPAVWNRLYRLFAHVGSLRDMPESPRLIEAIAKRFENAPMPTEPYFVGRLLDLMPAHAASIGRIAEILVFKWADKLRDEASSFMGVGQEMLDLAITLHRHPGTESLGLNMFEQLLRADAYQAREILDEIDNRIRRGGQPTRPRLGRKRPRASWRRTKVTELASSDASRPS